MKQQTSFLFPLLIALLLPVGGFSQSINGTIADAMTQQPIPFVNVGILHKNMGTVSDEQGRFSLPVSGFQAGDTIRISSIGYSPSIMTIREAQAFCLEQACVITLDPQETTLEEVVIVPKDYKDRVLGNNNTPNNMQAGFSENKLGYEMGVLMKVKRKPAYIQEVSFEIATCTYDTIFYRLNIYEMNGKNPGRNLLREPIYLRYTKDQVSDVLTVDLRDRYIRVEDDFVVSLELVKDLGEGNLMLKTGFMNNPTFIRQTSQGDWEKIRFGVGIFALVKQEQ